MGRSIHRVLKEGEDGEDDRVNNMCELHFHLPFLGAEAVEAGVRMMLMSGCVCVCSRIVTLR